MTAVGSNLPGVQGMYLVQMMAECEDRLDYVLFKDEAPPVDKHVAVA